jgi:molybdopterin molybdotransferase
MIGRCIFVDTTKKSTSVISVEEAIKAIDDNVSIGSVTSVPLTEALGYMLAANIESPINMPPFQQSAMDGFAICSNGGQHI